MYALRTRTTILWYRYRTFCVRICSVCVAVALLGALVYASVVVKLPACGGWFRPACDACPGLEAATSALSAGRYDEVPGLINTSLPCWKDFQNSYDQDLSVKLRLEYLPGRRGSGTKAAARPSLSTNDPYYFVVTPSNKAYLYMFQVDVEGRVTVIFPNTGKSDIKNPLAPGEQRVPGLNRMLTVGPKPGVETIYMVAANWEIPELQNLLKEAGKKPGARISDRLRARVALDSKYAAPLAGLAFGKWEIESMGSPTAANQSASH